MCRELSAIGTKEPQYHLVAFIMKASVWANVLEEGQEKTISDQKRPESDQIKMILELIKEKIHKLVEAKFHTKWDFMKVV